jgi:autotransporter-associated beta strand protein
LQVGNGGATGTLGISSVVNNAALIFNRNASADLTVASAISGSGTLTQLGAGKTILTSDNTYTGTTTISSGTLQIGTGGTIGSISSTSAITDNGSLIINRSDALTLSQNISGSGSLTQAGSGTTTLLGANSYGATNISAGTLQIGNGGTTGTLGTGAVVNNGTLKLNRSTTLAIANAISGTGGITQLGSGTSTLSGNNTYTGATNVNAGTLQAGSLTAFGNGDLVTVSSGATVDVAGFAVTNPFSLNGAGVASLGALVNTGVADTLTGTITLTGDTTIGGTGDLTFSNSIIGAYGVNVIDTGSFTATNTSNNISKIAANGVSGLSFLNSSALEIGSVNGINGITSTGQVAITTASGNLTVSQDISTTSTSTSAILLNAGQTASAGTATGGNIVLSGTRAFSTGANGRATLMTGSIADSTGMSALLNGLDHSRYNSDESNTNYSVALGSGVYGIYREQPTATVTTNADTKIYDAISYAGGNGVTVSNLANGDSNADLSGTLTYSGTAQNSKNAGSYTLTSSGQTSALGYALTYVDGSLTITPKALTLTAASVSKTYDGGTTYSTQAGDLTALSSQLMTGDAVTSATISFADKNAATGNKIVTLDAVAINDGNNGGNYTITRAGNNTSTITPKALTLTAAAVSKTYDGATTYSTQAADITALTNQLITGDAVSSATISFVDKNAASGSKVVTLDAATISDGNNGANYTITRAGNSTSTITPKALTLTASAVSKTYDLSLIHI